jgi:hypothetical protein
MLYIYDLFTPLFSFFPAIYPTPSGPPPPTLISFPPVLFLKTKNSKLKTVSK